MLISQPKSLAYDYKYAKCVLNLLVNDLISAQWNDYLSKKEKRENIDDWDVPVYHLEWKLRNTIIDLKEKIKLYGDKSTMVQELAELDNLIHIYRKETLDLFNSEKPFSFETSYKEFETAYRAWARRH